jgi:hypothetical protein
MREVAGSSPAATTIEIHHLHVGQNYKLILRPDFPVAEFSDLFSAALMIGAISLQPQYSTLPRMASLPRW